MSERLPHEKGFHVSWDQLHRDSRALAWRLDDPKLTENGWRAVVAITRGGMAPAMIVARELDIRVVDTISVKSYNHQSQSEPRVIKAPDMDHVGDGTGVLVIDDLVDTGKTLEVVRQHMPKAHVATVYAKPLGRSQVDTFITEVSQDTWIFFPWIWPCNMLSRFAERISREWWHLPHHQSRFWPVQPRARHPLRLKPQKPGWKAMIRSAADRY